MMDKITCCCQRQPPVCIAHFSLSYSFDSENDQRHFLRWSRPRVSQRRRKMPTSKLTLNDDDDDGKKHELAHVLRRHLPYI